MADVQRARHRGRRGVDGVDSRRGRPTGRSGRCRPPPSGPTRWPRGPRDRASRGSRPARTARPGAIPSRPCVMIGLPYPACSGSTTPPPARWRRSGCGSPGGCPCTSAARPCTTSPHLGHGRFALVFDVLRRYLVFAGLRRHLRVQHHRHRRQDHRPGRRRGRARSTRSPRPTRHVWWEVMDALGRAAPGRDPARHRLRRPDGRADRGAGGARGAPTRPATASTCRCSTCPATACSPTSPSTRLRAGARVEADEEKRSPLDFVLWKKAKPGEPTWESPWGAGPARAGTPSAW